MGSPPPAGSKKAVLKFRSVRSIVIAPAKTGNERRRRTAVIFTDQTNSGRRSNSIARQRILITVVMKLIAPKIEEMPARWREKMARSTDAPLWAKFPERGGYTVHPVPTPLSTNAEDSKRIKAGGNSQKLILFIRGNAISGAPSIKGTSQFPNPPIITGITKKKIITKACAVTITLYNWLSPKRAPGWPSSARIRRLKDVPTNPDQIPKRK